MAVRLEETEHDEQRQVLTLIPQYGWEYYIYVHHYSEVDDDGKELDHARDTDLRLTTKLPALLPPDGCVLVTPTKAKPRDDWRKHRRGEAPGFWECFALLNGHLLGKSQTETHLSRGKPPSRRLAWREPHKWAALSEL